MVGLVPGPARRTNNGVAAAPKGIRTAAEQRPRLITGALPSLCGRLRDAPHQAMLTPSGDDPKIVVDLHGLTGPISPQVVDRIVAEVERAQRAQRARRKSRLARWFPRLHRRVHHWMLTRD